MDNLVWFITVPMPYAAAAICVLGLMYRAGRWAFMPKHVKWTLYPPPKTPGRQAKFMAGEIFAFRAIFKVNRPLWAGAWLFHVAMALLVLLFILLLAGYGSFWLAAAGMALLGATSLYLIAFRLTNQRARMVSTPVEFFNLLIFLAMGVLGLCMLFVQKVDQAALREYFMGLITLKPAGAPDGPFFVPALALLELFLAYFPFSRMVHMVSKYFAFHDINWEYKKAKS